MARKEPRRRKREPPHPSRFPNPEELLSFVESSVFSRSWKDCSLTDDDLFQVQRSLLALPKGHPVIAGTGGLRKMRFSPAGRPRGKSGSHRVCYVYYEEHGLVLLVTVYPKSKRDDLSVAARKAIRKLIEEQYQLLARGRLE